jgi:hypothetical protein
MQKGLEKATAAQLIFSKAGAEMIPVANAMAREGFDKVTESASKLGILFSQQTVNDFRAAKAAMKELHGAGQGMAAQFLSGVLPSVTVVAEGFVDMATAGGKPKEAFNELGKYAGLAIQYIALGFIGLEETLGAVAFSIYDAFHFVWQEIRTESETELKAIALASQGHFIEAAKTAVAGIRTLGSAATDEANRQKAVFGQLGERFQKDYANLTKTPKDLPPGGDEPPGKVPDDSAGEKARADLREQSESERIAKAETEFLIHQLQSDLEEWKSYEKLREQEEKTAYEESQLTTAQYHERRRADIKAEAEQELNILRQQMEAADAEVTRSAESRTENLAKQASLKAQASGVGEHSDEGKKLLAAAAEYGAAAAREQESGLAAASRQYEFLKKTKALQNETQTKLLADVAETNKETEEGYKKVQEFEAELLALQGKRVEQTKAQINAEVEGRRKELTKEPGGRSPDEINAEIEKFRQLKFAAADFAEVESEIGREEKSLQIDTSSYEIARKSIEAEQKAGLLSKAEAETIVEPVGRIQDTVNEAVKKILPLLGPSERTERLRERSEMIAAKALRIELARSFRNHGLKGIFADLRDARELSFCTVIGDFLESLRAALSTLLPPGGSRRRYRAAQNISALHLLSVSAGELIVLDSNDEKVIMLVKSGALQEVADAPAAEGASA